MSLEELLKPVKVLKEHTFDIADEWILRQYTKATSWLEKKGHDKYSICTAVAVGSAAYLMLRNVTDHKTSMEYIKENPIQENKTLYAMTYTYWGLLLHDFVYTAECDFNRRIQYLDSAKIVDKFQYASQKIQRGIRLPLLIWGASGFSDFAAALQQNFSWDSFAQRSDFLIGGGLMLALASSMYIKDTDPKLLQKELFWKRAYAAINDKITALAPNPAPSLEPVQRDQTLA